MDGGKLAHPASRAGPLAGEADVALLVNNQFGSHPAAAPLADVDPGALQAMLQLGFVGAGRTWAVEIFRAAGGQWFARPAWNRGLVRLRAVAAEELLRAARQWDAVAR